MKSNVMLLIISQITSPCFTYQSTHSVLGFWNVGMCINQLFIYILPIRELLNQSVNSSVLTYDFHLL